MCVRVSRCVHVRKSGSEVRRGRPQYVLNVYRKIGKDKLAVDARRERRELFRGEVGGSSWNLEHGCFNCPLAGLVYASSQVFILTLPRQDGLDVRLDLLRQAVFQLVP